MRTATINHEPRIRLSNALVLLVFCSLFERSSADESTYDWNKARTFWAFRATQAPSVPQVKDPGWARNEIDRFLQARWESVGFSAAPDADPEILARRLYFDLTGLPPTPEETADFVAAHRQQARNAIASLVDRLLDSPAFGETWGRHWLDLARYADSNGGDINLTHAQAWRYRDYVVNAFNRDKPYNTFIREQLAGDLMTAADVNQQREQMVATGFLLMAPKMLSERDKEKLRLDIADEQVDTVGRVFMGLSLGCARCHDHKFDPIPTRDYYALAGIFRSTVTADGIRMNNVNVSGWIERDLPQTPEQLLALARYERDLSLLQEERKRMRHDPEALAACEAALSSLEASAPKTEKAMVARDQPVIENLAIRLRGDVSQQGVVVPRGFLQMVDLGSPAPSLPMAESGRRELADWIADPRHPLTSRVLVNRLWQHLFGKGLVGSVDNFGLKGDRPTHPELLDWMAREFIADDWSVKRALRRILLSRTYALAVTPDTEEDVSNQLLTHQNRRRLPAEALRDALLSMSDLLDGGAAGSPVAELGEQAIPNSSKGITSAQKEQTGRQRSLYLPMVRGDLPGFLETFDLANPDVPTGDRQPGTSPSQAMALWNAPLVKDLALATVTRSLDPTTKTEAVVTTLYQRILNRTPGSYDLTNAVWYVDDLQQGEPLDRTEALASLARALIASSEFRFLD